MARKEMITIDKILDTAFAMTREEGFANVTARRVAAKAGCSTQPIFRVYKNMEELWDAVYERAAAYFLDYYSLYPRTGKTPFANLGMAYILFFLCLPSWLSDTNRSSNRCLSSLAKAM